MIYQTIALSIWIFRVSLGVRGIITGTRHEKQHLLFDCLNRDVSIDSLKAGSHRKDYERIKLKTG